MRKFIGIGNALVDVLAHIADEGVLADLHLPKGGMTLVDAEGLKRVGAVADGFAPVRATGGSASNTIHALAVMGHSTGFVGSVGDDAMGRYYEGELRERGTAAALHRSADLPTGIATTFITPDGERTFATHLGAAADISVDDLRSMIGDGSSCASCTGAQPSLLHVEGYLVQDHKLITDILQTARSAGLTVSFDLASWNIVESDHEFITGLVRDYVDIVFANEEEAAAFSRQRDPEVALSALAAAAHTAIVKVGARGAIGQSGGERAAVPGLERMPVDTTAAGDFFAAGFLHGWAGGAGLERSLDYGNRLASEVIQVYGTHLQPALIREAVGLK